MLSAHICIAFHSTQPQQQQLPLHLIDILRHTKCCPHDILDLLVVVLRAFHSSTAAEMGRGKGHATITLSFRQQAGSGSERLSISKHGIRQHTGAKESEAWQREPAKISSAIPGNNNSKATACIRQQQRSSILVPACLTFRRAASLCFQS